MVEGTIKGVTSPAFVPEPDMAEGTIKGVTSPVFRPRTGHGRVVRIHWSPKLYSVGSTLCPAAHNVTIGLPQLKSVGSTLCPAGLLWRRLELLTLGAAPLPKLYSVGSTPASCGSKL